VPLEEGRVCEVFAPRSTGRSGFGSGYFVTAELILTASHVVDGALGTCEVRPLGSKEWLPTALAWRGKACDAALLRISPADPTPQERVPLGRLATGKPAACEALGFPLAQAKVREARSIRDTERIRGEVDPLSARKEGLLTIHVGRSVPTPAVSGHSPWAGMSGAALFCGRLLVAVVAVDPARFGTDRLSAVPVSTMAEDAGFWAALGVPAPELLFALEDEPARALLAPPYRPLPERATPDFFRRSPSHLLRPEFGIVPFGGRDRELAELAEWRADDGLGVALLLGRGGTGKTRLAAELCRTQDQEGRLAGFLAANSGPETLADAVAPLLLVLDDAQTRLGELAALLAGLVHAERARQIHILLLAREGGEWWEHRLPQRLEDEFDAQLALEAAWVRDLALFERSESARQEAFHGAARAFAAKTDRSSEGLSAPDLNQELFETILFIHLAALTALERGPMPQGPVIRDSLLGSRIEREARYWEDTARDEGVAAVDDRVRRRAVALATLTMAETEGEAAAALAAVPDLAGEPQEPLRRRVANWLRTLYPGTGWLRPLEPDTLGDALLAEVLADVPELGRRVLVHSPPAQVGRVLTVLTRAAQDHEAAERALAEALRNELPSVWKTAIEVAQETGEPLGRLLAQAVEEVPRAGLADEMLARLPARTIALRDLSAAATRQALDRLLERPAGRERDAELAALFSDFSNRLADLDEHEDALAAAEEAVTLYRRLAEAKPNAFRPGLAIALNNLSVRLPKLDRWDEALTAVEEAVEIRRRLAREDPDAFLSDLASSLINLSSVLAHLRRRAEALTAIEGAVEIHRHLTEEHPHAIRPDLAFALLNLSASLADLGRREEALARSREGVALLRFIAEKHPDAFLADLARALSNLSNLLKEAGEGEALTAIREAVEIRRRLAQKHPDALLSDLAGSLIDLSNLLAHHRRGEEALDVIEEAVAIQRYLAEKHADTWSLRGLGVVINNLSNRLSEVGEREKALAAIQDAVFIRRRLAEQQPAAYSRDLGDSLNNLSVQLAQSGNWEDALDAVKEAIEIRRRLAEEDPDAFLRDLADSLVNLYLHLASLGRREEALAAIEDAVTCTLPLFERMPHTLRGVDLSVFQMYVSVSSELGHDVDPNLGKRIAAVVQRAGFTITVRDDAQ
jgi:Trypsin-like peptidase domain/Tetratricopeptide repeat